jgi:pimeloyl-ACP methyl ester carboxylesterase
MINTFRSSMPLPILGIGHSLGGNMLVNLSLMHPRLLTTLILLDPVIQQHASAPSGPNPAHASTFRRDLWPSRQEAEKAFKKSKFYQSWDRRVLDRWCEFGVRECPTALFPDEEGKVTLTTTKHQECLTFMRPSWEGMDASGSKIINRDLLPDMHMGMLVKYPFYRPEPPNTLDKLPEVRPSVLYVFGETSPMSSPEVRKRKLETTGMGVGGSGGAKEGKVKEIVLKGVGHLVAMEATGLCADAAAGWVGDEIRRWERERKKYVEWTKKSLSEKSTLSEEWKKWMSTTKGKL